MRFNSSFRRFTKGRSAFPLILLATLLFPASKALGQITLTSVTNCGPTSFPAACTIPSTGAGQLLVIGWTGGQGSNAVVTSITDDAGNTYTEAGAAKATVSSEGLTSDIWYAADISAGATSITITASPQGSQGAAVIWEFSGASTSPLDQTAVLDSQPASTAPSGASVTTTAAHEVVVSIAPSRYEITGIHAGDNFTEDSSIAGNGWAHRITTSSGGRHAEWTETASGVYCSSTASFKSGGGGGDPTYLLSASPTSLSFGNVPVGTQSVLPIILTNTGTGSVTITQDTIAGTGFSGSGLSLPFTLASGQNTDLSITFAPTAGGSVTGSASVVSNASNSPAVVSLSGTGTHYVDLAWTASTSSGVTGYDIYRGTASGGPYTQINSSSVAGTTYTDSTVAAGQTYYYVATAVNSSGVQSGYSNQASATVPSP
jgi:hypothetical protein